MPFYKGLSLHPFSVLSVNQLASSEATVEIDNFSDNPQDIRTLADTNTVTFASSGSVIAQADANAIANFDPNNPPKLISNFSFSKTSGEGSSYSGLAQSQAGVIAYNFFVGDGKPFSFDFNAVLGLNTSIDNPQSESASAAGGLSFNLYDSTDSNNLKLLDSLTISGNLITPGDGDYLDSQVSNNITLTSNLKNISFGGIQEAASASVQGQFSRDFANPTYLSLIEVKANQASVAVPESSNPLALFFFGSIGVGLRVRSKLTRKPKLTSTTKPGNFK